MRYDPVRLPVAAERLKKPETTVRVWGTRYNARRFRIDGFVYWDYNDLSTIDACIWRGDPVPKSPEERDRLRAGLAA